MDAGMLRAASVVLLALSLWSCSVRAATVHLYVSPTGSDSHDGRQVSHPVKTLHRAKDLLQEDGIRGNTVFVELMAGYYYLQSPLHFVQDMAATVVFRAYQGQEVHVVGGTRMPSDQFHPVTDQHVLQRLPQESRDKVLEFDLAAAGISDLGTLTQFGFYVYTWTAPMEIFINGKPLHLAEWPNFNFINIRGTPDGPQGLRFTYNESEGRDVNWALETEPWAYGYWYHSYNDRGMPLASIDPQTKTITLKVRVPWQGMRPGHYDPTGAYLAGNADQGGYFRVTNMLCELDLPGEYFIDRAAKKLYLWPNTAEQTLTSSDLVYGTVVNQCIRVESSVKNVHFEDFSVEGCRQYGIELINSTDITIKNMDIKNTGSFGVHCTGDCRRVSILASEIHDVGGGISIQGGEMTTLTSSEVMIRDNEIWDHSRVAAQPGDAIHMGGVHVTVVHNHLHHGQYSGVLWTGNEHVMEYNHVHHYCWNASDCGAFHAWGEWTYRGNVIRRNVIHHTLRGAPGSAVRGIMLDDEYSSVLIEHNVLFDNEVHISIGGGRDNVVRENVMVNSSQPAMQVDGRGLSDTDRMRNWVKHLYERLEETPYQTALWQSRYPDLVDFKNKTPPAPLGNQIYHNIFHNTQDERKVGYYPPTLARPDYYDQHDNYGIFDVNDFWSIDDADFRLRCEAAQWAQDNNVPQTVSMDQVGPRVPTGPSYLRAHRQPDSGPRTTHAPQACDTSTVAPATTTPRTSYLPDGSSPNSLYPDIPKAGCHLVINHCPSHPELEGTHQDDLGTRNSTEEGCLSRAGPQWVSCGSPDNGQVVAVYGPTGAMTIGGEGCFYADYGCQSVQAGQFHRDYWAEQHENGSWSEENCLWRALNTWKYCGSHPDRPVTSIFRPTGAFRTAGAGCWIKIPSCPANPARQGFFYDAWGATNDYTDEDEDRCFARARVFWTECGSHDDVTVTAFYRPNASQRSVP